MKNALLLVVALLLGSAVAELAVRLATRLTLPDRLMDHSRLVWLVRSKVAGMRPQPTIDADAGVGVVLASLRGIRRLGQVNGARVHGFAHRRANQVSSLRDSVWNDFIGRSAAVDITSLFRLARTGPRFGHRI